MRTFQIASPKEKKIYFWYNGCDSIVFVWLGRVARGVDMVVPFSNPRSRFVNSQLVSLPASGDLKRVPVLFI